MGTHRDQSRREGPLGAHCRGRTAGRQLRRGSPLVALLGLALAACGGCGPATAPVGAPSRPSATLTAPPSSESQASPQTGSGGPTLLITSTDGFKVMVSLVSADKSATADPSNPAPPGLTSLVLQLKEHNVQTDRPAPLSTSHAISYW
jgi:hypothetical protein